MMIDPKAKNLRDNVMASNQIIFIVYLALAISLGAVQVLAAGEDPQCLAEIDKAGSEIWIGMKIYDRSFGRGCATCHDVAPNPDLFESVKTITFDEFDTVMRQGRNAMPKASRAILEVSAVKTAGYDETQAIQAVYNYLKCQSDEPAPEPIDPAPVEPVPDPISNLEFLKESINHAEAGIASANKGDLEGALTNLKASLNSLREINSEANAPELQKAGGKLRVAWAHAKQAMKYSEQGDDERSARHFSQIVPSAQVGIDQLKNINFTVVEACTLDADGNANVDALTDGLLLIRHMFGIRGESLVKDATGIGCAQCSASDIEAYLDQCAAIDAWDIDGNGEIDALTDGLLTIRYIFGIRQEALISNSVANGCTRCTVAEVEVYLQELLP
jgi:hypothetical protein